MMKLLVNLRRIYTKEESRKLLDKLKKKKPEQKQRSRYTI